MTTTVPKACGQVRRSRGPITLKDRAPFSRLQELLRGSLSDPVKIYGARDQKRPALARRICIVDQLLLDIGTVDASSNLLSVEFIGTSASAAIAGSLVFTFKRIPRNMPECGRAAYPGSCICRRRSPTPSAYGLRNQGIIPPKLFFVVIIIALLARGAQLFQHLGSESSRNPAMFSKS